MISTNPQLFRLLANKVSVGLARDRLWQVKSGNARLRVLVNKEVRGEINVPDSGWFVVPESETLQVQLVAISDVSFESRLPLNLIPRLGDLGRQQLIQPIREVLRAASVDDSLVDWPIKLSQPGFRSWFSESLHEAIRNQQPMSPDVPTPLIADQAPRTILEQTMHEVPEGHFVVHALAGTLAILAVLTYFLNLVLIESPAFGLSLDYPIAIATGTAWIGLSSVVIHTLNQRYDHTLIIALSVGLAMCLLSLLWMAPGLALALIFSLSLIAGAYWVYVRRLLPTLPNIDQPMRWLSLRLARDGVPSVRFRVIEVWDQAREWVISRIELVAEYSRFSRAVISGSLVVPAIAMTETSSQIVITGLTLLTIIILDRLRAALPVSIDNPSNCKVEQARESPPLSGDIEYEDIVFRRHAGDRPLFNFLNFQCKANSLVRITALEGAGLSTLKALLIRRVSPERGVIRIGGMDIARIEPEVLAYSIVMLDHPNDDRVKTVADWLFIEPGIQVSTLEYHLTGMRAGHWIEQLPNRLESPIGSLYALAGPHGINRLKLARALSRNGQIIWLDHWLIGLTKETREHVVRSLIDRSGTRFLVDRNSLMGACEHVRWDVS